MCGRFALGIPSAKLAEFFNLSDIDTREEFFRYNLAPTDMVPGIVGQPENASRRLTWFRWGLIPSWSKDITIGPRMINARAETLREKPSFKTAYKKRRCLIPAKGFYEWEHHGKNRQPWFFQRTDGEPMAFAGLWERWTHETANIFSCTIITTAANDMMAPIHDRMPVILGSDEWEQWLAPETGTELLDRFMQPTAVETLELYPVSPAVNNAQYEGEECIIPLRREA